MEVDDVQAAIADAVKTVPGILQSLPTLPDAIDPPSFGCTELELDYNQSFGGLVITLYSFGLFTSRADDASGRSLLNTFLKPTGAASIKAAIEADRRLGGACSNLIVERVRGAYRLYGIGGNDYLGAIFDVRVWS